MSSKNPRVSRAVINLANACRTPDDTDGLIKARADLAEAKIEDFIEKTLAAAPPLSGEQRSRLARLLTSGGEGR